MKIDYAEVKKIIIEGEIQKALQLLEIETFGTDFSMEVIMLASRENSLRKQIGMGTVDSGDANREKNQIIAAILDLLDRLEDDFLTNQLIFEWAKLYAAAWDAPQPDDYEVINDVATFKSAETSTVYWVVLMSYSQMVADFKLNFEWFITFNKSPLMGRVIHEFELPKDTLSMYTASGYAVGEVGDWPVGEYTFELYCKGKMIFNKPFTVV